MLNTPVASFWYLYCSLSTYLTPCSVVSIVNLEHVIAGWDNQMYNFIAHEMFLKV